MNFAQLRKIEAPAARRAAVGAASVVTAIIRVTEPGYRPAGVKVRGEITGELFTGELPTELLDALEHDPKVSSISLSRPLQVQGS